MNLSQQVCSLELSKRLKELGVKQESYFYWIYTDGVLPDGTRDKIVVGNTLGDSHWELGGEKDTYSAFTVAELGESMKDTSMECIWFPDKNQWGCFGTLDGVDTFYADTEADARGFRLEYLITNKLMTL